jgi:hypothetical protein
VRHNYDSFDYWEELIDKHKTLRGQMFMDLLPNKGTIYVHTLVFSKNNGINNTWTYFPNVKVLLGYIQYSFLQEAFYKWIYGKERIVVTIPNVPVEKIVSDGEKNNKITKTEANEMRRHINMIKSLWSLPQNRILAKLKNFARDFNKTWVGDNREFLYLKIFSNSVELGEFVINSNYITRGNNFEEIVGVSTSEWKEICEKAEKNKSYGEKFRNTLLKSLNEII